MATKKPLFILLMATASVSNVFCQNQYEDLRGRFVIDQNGLFGIIFGKTKVIQKVCS